MKRLVKSEMYRLIHRKSSYFALFFSVFMSILFTAVFTPAAKYGNKARIIAAINYQSKLGYVFENSNSLINAHAVLTNINIFLFFIIIPTLVCIIISGERGNGSLRMIFTRTYSKGEVFVSKFITIALFNLITLILIFITSFISGKIMMPKITSTKILFYESLLNSSQSFLFNIKFYLIFFIQIVMLSAIFSLVSTFCKNTVVGILLNIGLAIACGYFSNFIINFMLCPVTYIYDILSGRISLIFIAMMLVIIVALTLLLKKLWDILDFAN